MPGIPDSLNLQQIQKGGKKNSANYAVQQEINMTVYSNTDM